MFLGLSLTGLANDLAYSPGWLNLIHYQRTLRGFLSEADGTSFFLSPAGKSDPAAELAATLSALQETTKLYGKLQRPAACVFTARRLFLERQGHVFPQVNCEDYQAWRTGLPVQQLSLVFAASYPNNPASMFGHTFLRLSGPGGGNPLLDYAVNFAATTGSDGGVEFAVLGVFGGYQGHFSLAPYFVKVNEYNNSEARDLWEYPLSLSPAAIDLLLAHLWELESTTYFDYYFFDENCSWQILRLLEAAEPQLQLTRRAPFYIIPGETVQHLAQQELLQTPTYRPSLRQEFLHTQDPVMRELLRYRIEERKGKLTEPQRYHDLLAQRAASGKGPPMAAVPTPPTRPDWGHRLRRVTLTQGDHFRRLGFRFAHHDLLDNDRGHEQWSGLDILRIVGEERDGVVSLREAVLADVASFHNLSGLGVEPSWLLKFGLMNPREFSCQKCLSAGAEAGLGLSHHTEGRMFGVFAVGKAQGKALNASGPWWASGPRVMLGGQSKRLKGLVTLEKLSSAQGSLPWTSELAGQLHLATDWAVRGHVLLREKDRPFESGLSLLFYF